MQQIILYFGKLLIYIDLYHWYIIPRITITNNMIYENSNENNYISIWILCFTTCIKYTNKRGRKNKAYRKSVLSDKNK